MNNVPLETLAEEFAIHWHGAQVRNYTGEPYWHHCRNVAQLVKTVSHTSEMVAAAWCHDTLEDTQCTREDVALVLGTQVAVLVEALTDEFTSERYPKLNRARRKEQERYRLAGVSPEAQTIKLADMLDNTRNIAQHDPNFWRVYRLEKLELLQLLQKGDMTLWLQAAGAVHL